MTWPQEYAADQTTLARTIAYVAHKPQMRAGEPPEPYIKHVHRVASHFPPGPERCVALLHDVVEDTPITPMDLAGLGVDPEVVLAVVLLTHAHKISHDAYIDHIQKLQAASKRTHHGRWARAVKLADLQDNASAVPRLIAARQHALAKRLGARYDAALEVLEGK